MIRFDPAGPVVLLVASESLGGGLGKVNEVVGVALSRRMFGVVVMTAVYSFLIATVMLVLDAVDVAMTEAAGLPVELQVLTTGVTIGEEVETSNAAFAEIIDKTLAQNLQNSQLIEFTFQVGNPFIVEVTVTTELDSTSEELQDEFEAVEAALADALGITVLLDVTIQSEEEL